MPTPGFVAKDFTFGDDYDEAALMVSLLADQWDQTGSGVQTPRIQLAEDGKAGNARNIESIEVFNTDSDSNIATLGHFHTNESSMIIMDIRTGSQDRRHHKRTVSEVRRIVEANRRDPFYEPGSLSGRSRIQWFRERSFEDEERGRYRTRVWVQHHRRYREVQA